MHAPGGIISSFRPCARTRYHGSQFPDDSVRAGFGQLTYEVLRKTNLTVGARYTNEDKGAVDGSTTLGVLGGGPTLATIPAADAELTRSQGNLPGEYRPSIQRRTAGLRVIQHRLQERWLQHGIPGSAPYLPEKAGSLRSRHSRLICWKGAQGSMPHSFYYDHTKLQVQQFGRGRLQR